MLAQQKIWALKLKNNMLLSDREIKRFIKTGKIKIIPKPDLSDQIGPASLDLRLGYEIRVFNHIKKPYIDPKNEKTFRGLTEIIKLKKNQPFVLQSHQFILGVTLEEVTLDSDLAARIEGRSSWGRIGLIIHSTAGYVDPGFKGRLTLEMTNIGNLPILLYPEIKICQLAFEVLSSSAEIPYPQRKSSKYFNDQLPNESRIYKELKKKKNGKG